MPLSYFDELFNPMQGKRIGFVRGEYGNVGDTLQEQAVFEFFKIYGINARWLGPVVAGREPWDWCRRDGQWAGECPQDIDELVLFGGGNMGINGASTKLRALASAVGKPMTILPNTWRDIDIVANCYRYTAREKESIRLYCSEAELFPDVVLGFDFPRGDIQPTGRCGVFLRKERESNLAALVTNNLGAPFGRINKRDTAGYMRLAQQYQTIITDALHFAIVGLAYGRDVYIAPGAYHKNRSMYDTWLSALGCKWVEDARQIEVLAAQ